MTAFRSAARAVARTPLHPQWLLGPRRIPQGLSQATGALLDIGAADRWIGAHVPAAVRYVALDYPSTGRDMYGARPDVFADGARLPFADATFDNVVCLEVLEHVPDPAIVVAEIARVLRPGGQAWLSMPFLYPVHDAPFDFQRYTIYGLRRDLERSGMAVASAAPVGNALRTVGVLACLAVSGGVYQRGGAYWLLAPVAAILVLVVNCLAWVSSHCWPDWDGISTGNEVKATKP